MAGGKRMTVGAKIAQTASGCFVGILVLMAYRTMAITPITESSDHARGDALTVPPPATLLELVSQSNRVIVGTITGIVGSGTFGGYDQSGVPLPASSPSATRPILNLPYTDFGVNVDQTVCNDHLGPQGSSIVLRIVGHSALNGQTSYDMFPHEPVGTSRLFFLSVNPDQTTFGLLRGGFGRLTLDEPILFTDSDYTEAWIAHELTIQELIDEIAVACP